jgi:hypothetical protein
MRPLREPVARIVWRARALQLLRKLAAILGLTPADVARLADDDDGSAQ